jgi:hypothetical protein
VFVAWCDAYWHYGLQNIEKANVYFSVSFPRIRTIILHFKKNADYEKEVLMRNGEKPDGWSEQMKFVENCEESINTKSFFKL